MYSDLVLEFDMVQENHKDTRDDLYMSYLWILSNLTVNADCPVCLIPLPRFLCLHASVFHHYCLISIDVDHYDVYTKCAPHPRALLALNPVVLAATRKGDWRYWTL